MLLTIATLVKNCLPQFLRTKESFMISSSKCDPSLLQHIDWMIVDSSTIPLSKSDVSINIKTHYHFIQPSGIYNAMNYAINNASAKYILFINAGDLICDLKSLIQSTIDFSIIHPAKSALIFNIWLSDLSGHKIIRYPNSISAHSANKLFLKLNPHHQAIIFKLSWHKFNLYDPSFGASADSPICKKAAKNSTYINISPTVFHFDGLTSGAYSISYYTRSFASSPSFKSLTLMLKSFIYRLPLYFYFRIIVLRVKIYLILFFSKTS